MGKLQTIVTYHDIMSDTGFSNAVKKSELFQKVSYVLKRAMILGISQSPFNT